MNSSVKGLKIEQKIGMSVQRREKLWLQRWSGEVWIKLYCRKSINNWTFAGIKLPKTSLGITHNNKSLLFDGCRFKF